MEKLQKALQKAREQRDSHNDLKTRPKSQVPSDDTSVQALNTEAGDSDDPSLSIEALWKALTPFDPQQQSMERHRIVAAASSKLSAPFDILRTKVLFAMQKNGWTRLGITSPTMGCGKTTTACNLAIASARNPDQRTILLELDLRRPSIADIFDLPETKDITEMLMGKVTFGEQALRYRQNVAVAAARTVSTDPTSVLTSRNTQKTLDEIEAVYAPDLIVLDLPPLLVGDDTRSALKHMDCVLLVARSNVTTISQIDSSEREIAEHTNVLGVVLNQCRDFESRYD